MTSAMEFKSAAVTDRGLNEGRPQNEDSYIELAQYGVFCVADGVGGAQAGEVASQMAVEILGEAFIHMGDADPEDTMRIALDRANEAIWQMSRDLPQLSSMATTIVALHVAGDIATIAHVGDSRVYRVDPNGRLFRETDDHSVVEEEVRAGRMTPEQALVHPSRNVISRALGAEDTVEPDVKCVLIHPATTFLLCSDGITRHVDDAEIEQLLNSDFGPEDICARMKEICFSRGAEDNLTAIVVQFPGERLSHFAAADDDEIEEVTLAGVREPVETVAVADFESAPITAGEAVRSEILDFGPETIDERPTLESIPASVDTLPPEPVEPTSTEPEIVQPLAVAEASLPGSVLTEEVTADPQLSPPSISSYPYEPDDARSRSGSSKLLTTLGALIAGIVLGLIGGYFLLGAPKPPAEVPVLTEQKSNNPQLTSFEETRRLVDEDPVRYLNANAATPKGAEDFFWLGRSLLLTGKPVEAKRAFEESRSRLSSFDDRSTARVMANEIAMALSIVDDEQALEAFARQIAASNAAAGGNANANSLSNTAPTR